LPTRSPARQEPTRLHVISFVGDGGNMKSMLVVRVFYLKGPKGLNLLREFTVRDKRITRSNGLISI
jgi:hypothetical protein